MSVCQYTLKQQVKAKGIGLHTGEKVTVTVDPAPANAGIRFVRSDIGPDAVIPARPEFVVDTQYATTLGNGNATISTVEHLMAALAGAGIDNACIEVDGPEVPAMDGSSAPFLTLFDRAGLDAQDEPRRFIEILETVEVHCGDKSLIIEPSKHFHVALKIEFDHPLIEKQHFSGKITSRSFSRHISRARTFGFLGEVELLRRNGLARGGSLDNAIVLGDSSVLNKEGLRFPDEFVSHKVLDLIGDMYLLGAPLLGKVTAVKSGHALHHVLTKELLKRSYAWRFVEQTRSWGILSWGGRQDESATAVAAL